MMLKSPVTDSDITYLVKMATASSAGNLYLILTYPIKSLLQFFELMIVVCYLCVGNYIFITPHYDWVSKYSLDNNMKLYDGYIIHQNSPFSHKLHEHIIVLYKM